MRVTYDLEVDVLRIELANFPIAESAEVRPDIILDYGIDGNLIGIEILSASQRVEDPYAVEYQMLPTE
ncbi:MAG: DUF2283 domain-containing protein [Anaerolineae bacterium]|nr:DUF2283 domain-containing protein [Anaerolineae bacterium]